MRKERERERGEGYSAVLE